MKKTNNTKQTLVMSVLSLVLCMSMLIGTTFAWFTDEVTSENNVITSGTLDITFEYANGTEDPKTAAWTDASTGSIFNYDKWEPGYTVARHLKIKNNGTLALNWDMSIVSNGEVSELANVIDVYYSKSNATQINTREDVSKLTYAGTLTEVINTGFAFLEGDGVSNFYNKLDAGKEINRTLVLKMREEAGNEYQNLSIGSDFAVQVLATQRTFEADDFGTNYDETATTQTTVDPSNAQEAIHNAVEGEIIYLTNGKYGDLVLENADGTPKKGITITHDRPGTGSEFSVASINLNSSEDITINGIYFDISEAEALYKHDKNTEYVASILGAKSGAETGAQNVVINNCKFNTYGTPASNYIAICFQEVGRKTNRATNITVTNCILEDSAFNFVRVDYAQDGTIIINNNNIAAQTGHSALNFTGNAADLIVRNNTFGLVNAFSGSVIRNGWNPEKAMLGSSRQGNNHVQIEVTANTFANTLVTGEGNIIDLKSSYNKENCTVVFKDNVFKGGLDGLTEATAPSNLPQ